jgi:hypothetical protein
MSQVRVLPDTFLLTITRRRAATVHGGSINGRKQKARSKASFGGCRRRIRTFTN